MGVWVLAGVFLFFLTEYHSCLSAFGTNYQIVNPTYGRFRGARVEYEQNTQSFNQPQVELPHNHFTIESSNTNSLPKNEDPLDQQSRFVQQIEEDDDFKDANFIGSTSGFKQYQTSRSSNYNGPHQIETIETKSFHRKSEPYSLHEFDHSHHGEEEHAEIHYHQHKHLHKHSHKQEHLHKHSQDHKHQHAHKHAEENMHKHAHKHDHKHKHSSSHDHKHEAHHKHEHKQEHKHDHHQGHKHEHKHHHDHKHDAHHKHGHKHDHDHKHDHHHGHKHSHHHGHKHNHDHKHKHGHKHSHGHKHHHKYYKHY